MANKSIKSYKNAPAMGAFPDGNDTPDHSPSHAASHKGGPKLKARSGIPSGPGPTTFGPAHGGAPKIANYPAPKRVPGSGANKGAGQTTDYDDGAL
jgi:hypothetical protein